ncbi:GNAT family N-acetyltransferase [Brevibacillus reuszeri]|uniref:GNAT family N-acetyltransferase n=1 Tax=Brevibacillus reuszeri TaxID=54915 RepID=UPI00289E3355|nr:GNAT family N-acetyltransferase [Brevibacillus reuszeri]
MRTDALEYRILTTAIEMAEMEDLQRRIWGETSVSPVPQLMAAIHNGGVVIAAYHDEKPVGFCYGFAGFKQGKAHLCSHMLGILPEYRDWGIGRQLKLSQREWAISNGYEKMTWTYDPLEARNAYLNLCKLGGVVRTYLDTYYGDMGDGINKGLPTDRFLLEWDLKSERVASCLNGAVIDQAVWREYPCVLDWELTEGQPRPVERQGRGEHDGILFSVPVAIQQLKQDHLAIALEWRLALRSVFKKAFADGYVLVGLLKSDNPVHAYVLERRA